MIKKILFFGIAIILGFMLLMMCYSGFQMSDVQAQITEYMQTNDYNSLARCFLPYFNSNSITTQADTDYFDLVSLESITSSSVTVSIDGSEQQTNDYNTSYTFFLNNCSNIDLEGVQKQDGQVYNYTRLVFLNGENRFEYYFNDPLTATSDQGEDVNRYYTTYIQNMSFVEIDLSLADIESIGGQITGYEFYDAKADPDNADTKPLVSGNFATPITLNSEFYTLADELVSAWDAYLDGLNSSNMEDKANTFNEFFDPAEGEGWIDRYNSHDGFSQGIRSYSDIIGSSPIYKTAIVMVIYVAVCVLLGVFLLRNKNKVPKPYMRDQYKRQLVVAKENSQDAKVTNVVDVTPTAVATDNVEEVKESTNLETTESVTKEDAEVVQTQDETNASEELNNTANLEATVEDTPKDVEANLNNKE